MKKIKIVLISFLACLPLSFAQAERSDSSEKWVALHLLGYNSDSSLELLGQRIPQLAAEGVNLLFLEIDYNFEFVSHPELRAGDQIISKAGAARFAALCKQHGIRLVPEFQSLGHQSWAQWTFKLLSVYPELDLTPNAFPNNEGIYCREWDPYNPKVNAIVFPLIDEILEAFDADGVHLGMDEVFLIVSDKALSTRDKDPAEVYAKVINDFHDYFTKQKGKQLYIWADRLIDGKTYNYGEWESSLIGTAPAVDMIPKDVILCDWHYEPRPDYASIPMFLEKGFRVLPTSFNNVEAVKALIKYSYQLEHPNMIGHLFTTWSVVPFDSLVKYRPMLEGINTIRSGKFYTVSVEPHTSLGQDSLQLIMSTSRDHHRIRYTLDGSKPGIRSALYTKPIKVGTSVVVKAVACTAHEVVGEVVEKQFVVHKGIGSDLTYQLQPSKKYTTKDGVNTLINGLAGSASYADGQWVGYEGQDLEIIIDLGINTRLSVLSFNSLNTTANWVHHADKVEVSQSGDGRIYNTLIEKPIASSKEEIVRASIPLNVTTRYLKIKISCKTIPAGFVGEGHKAWLFVDEIVIE